MATDEHSSLSNWQAINQIVGSFKSRMAVFGLCTIGVGLLEAFFLVVVTRSALSIADGLDQVGIFRNQSSSISQAIAICVALLLLRFLFSYLTVRVQTGLQYRITSGLRRDLGGAYLSTSWETQSRQAAGALQQLVVQFPANISSLVFQLSNALAGGLSLIALLGVALFVDIKSTAIILGSLAVITSVLIPMRRRVTARSRRTMDHQIEFAHKISEINDVSLEINALGVSNEATARLNEAINSEADASRRLNLLAGMMSPAYLMMAYGAILAALLFLSTIPTRDLNEVGAVMLIMLRSLSYGLQLEQGSIAVHQFSPYAEKLLETRDSFREGVRVEGDLRLTSIDSIEIVGVSFAYPNKPVILSEANFTIGKGEVIGLVGPSGAGKTTLIQLILGLREPDFGEVRVNGKNRRLAKSDSWSRLVTYVPQDTKLIAGTIDDNVKFLRDHVTDSDVDHALIAANLLLPADRFPEGKHTDLGVAGRQFSGGQKQRLAIARALATNPSVLVLDEPTSSLDVESENVIVETMNRLKGSVTTIVVTHRESTLRACDRIFLVEGGTVTETTADRVTREQLDHGQ